MSKIIRERQFLGDPSKWVFKSKTNGDLYQRITGGVILSGPKGGAVSVIGERPRLRPDEPHELTLLGLRVGDSIESTIRAALDLQADLKVQDFYTDSGDVGAMRYLELYNSKARDQRRSALYVMGGSYLESAPAYHLNILRQVLTPGKKLLYLAEFNAEVKASLAAIESEAVDKGKLSDFPLISSIALAIAPLVENEFIFGEERPGQAKTDYDELEHGVKRPGRHQAGQAITNYDVFGIK